MSNDFFNHAKTMERWTFGKVEIPYTTWPILCCKSELKELLECICYRLIQDV